MKHKIEYLKIEIRDFGGEDRAFDTARMLHRLASNIEIMNRWPDIYHLVDINGNSVGDAKLKTRSV